MKHKFFIIFFIACFLSLSVTSSCRTSQASKSQKKIDKTKAIRKKETEELYQNAVKKHQDIQTKETKKRMKKTKKNSGKINKPKQKTFFLSRWFKKDRCLD